MDARTKESLLEKFADPSVPWEDIRTELESELERSGMRKHLEACLLDSIEKPKTPHKQ